MSASEPPRIVAAIADAEQQAVMLSAGQQFSDCVGRSLGSEWPIRLRPVDPEASEIPPGIALVGFVAERGGGEPVMEIEARWRARVARYREQGHARILLCNLWRQPRLVAPSTSGVERLRLLKLLVIRLSRDLGVEVVDADRLVALCGARRIAADPRGAEVAAAEVVGHAVADAILEGEIGDAVEASVQARAKAIHGGVCDIPGLVARRLQPGTQG